MSIPLSAHQAITYGYYSTIILFILFSKPKNATQFIDRRKGAKGSVLLNNLLTPLLSITYAIEFIFTTFSNHNHKHPEKANRILLLLLAFLWLFNFFSQRSYRESIHFASILALLFEVPLLLIQILGKPKPWNAALGYCLPILRILILVIIATVSQFKESSKTEYGGVPSLKLKSEGCNGDDCSSIGDDSDSDSDDDASIKRRRAQRLKETGGWLGYLRDFSIFLPYLIPRNNRKVQACLVINLLCLVGSRALNVLVPRQLGIVTNQLLEGEFPFGALTVWFALTLLAEDSGVRLIESLVKVPIKQFSYLQLTNAAFSHVMSLSMEFHSDNDTAEVVRAIEQGESLANVLETLILEILPTLVDLVIAFGLLYWKFNIYIAFAMMGTSATFIALQATISNWNITARRESRKAQREEAQIMHQAVHGWQTVTYFNMFSHEKRRLGEAAKAHLAASAKWENWNAYTKALLEFLLPTSFFVLGSLVLYEISKGRASVGDFIFLSQYWEQLMFPVKMLTHDYRFLMTDLVDAERLMGLLQTKPTIADREDAKDLCEVKGQVVFDNVTFAYSPRKPTVRGISISAAPGQTIALVGETGAGKSSIMKLLLRFYDVSSGGILVDGHDVRDVRLGSLRTSIGVVPQDPLLFNTSVMENLRYARPSATDAEIFDACRAAAIHDKILGFVDSYETKVGEDGLKLSGGEIQRLAIARVFLKNPPILILDEATSAVDVKTESSIQRALKSVMKGRTTFVIAHRLSTIIDADEIVLIHDGKIVERGTHNELVRMKGRYHDLWAQQTRAAS